MIQQLAPLPKRTLAGSTGPSVEATDSVRRPRLNFMNVFMRIVRKVHLYSGLFLFPWVMLYAVTGYLFNHPRPFSEQAETKFGAAEIEGTPLKDLPQPSVLASQVVAAIEVAQQRHGRTGQVRLIEPRSAKFSREQAFVNASAGAKRYSVVVDLESGTGSVRTREEPSRAEVAAPPFADRDLQIDDALGERLRNGAVSVLEKMRLPAKEVVGVSVPELLFKVEAEGKPYQVAYSTDRGSLIARDAGQTFNPLTAHSFLTQLHLIHGYPSSLSARWCWAVAVDAMFVAMCFWGISGIMMWWQLKATRLWGAGFLLASVIIAAAMTIGMHRELEATGPGSRGAEAGRAGSGRHERPSEASRRLQLNSGHASPQHGESALSHPLSTGPAP